MFPALTFKPLNYRLYLKGIILMLPPYEQELLEEIVYQDRVSVQAAAYTIYVQMTPNNKKPISPREFHREFVDNWEMFNKIENKG